jgi:signal transduction histidine kinase
MCPMIPERPRTIDFPRPGDLDENFTALERAALSEINSQVAAGNSLEEILNFIFEKAQAIIPCDRLGIAFLEDEGRRVVAHYAVSRYEPILLKKGYSAELEGSSLERVLKSGHPRVINDLAPYALAHPRSESTRLLLNEGIRSSMTCPLTVQDRRVGFLFFSSKYPNAYSEREISLHLQVAERLSQAVEKAYRIEQLEASKRAYMEMLGFVSHELKNPIASLITEGRLLGEGYLGDLSEKQADMVAKMVRKGEYLLNLTREYLDLSRLEEGKLEPSFQKDVDLETAVLEPALEVVLPQFEEGGIRLERELQGDKVLADCDPDLLKVVAVNLLGNAAKYGDKGGRAAVGLRADGGTVRLSVWNEGPGFPPGEKVRLFRKFSRLKTPELLSRKGSGVGLYTSWWIVRQHAGRIWGESEHGSWARFTFEIPRHPATTPL